MLRRQTQLTLDDVAQVGSDTHGMLEVRRHGTEHVLVEQPGDRSQQVGCVGRELHERSDDQEPAAAATWPVTLSTPFGACCDMKPNMYPATRRIWISSAPSVIR